jgi:50S ribosomal protein L16 3-hydroxylase
MGVLKAWLAGTGLESFIESYLGRLPLAAPELGRAAASACGWSIVDELLASQQADTLVVARGELLPANAPHSLRELRALLERGVGVAVRRADRACEAVAAIAGSVADDLPGEQRTIVFATAKGSNGFAWHFDEEEVFILQTAGDKSYYFRANSVTPRPLRAEPPAFADYRKETSPLMTARLQAGDWLYLPSGYWHAAHAHEDSLSVSIGVLPCAAQLASRTCSHCQ